MPKMLPYSIARAFKPKDVFGEPRAKFQNMTKDADGIPSDGQVVVLGAIFGTAESVYVSKRTKPNGDVEYSYGLEGRFEAIPSDATKNPIRTNIAWLPSHIHAEIAGLLATRYNEATGEVIENPEGAESVDFAFEVTMKTSRKSSTGFTWEYNSKSEISTTADPLSKLRSSVADMFPALAAPALLEDGNVEAPPEGEARGEEPTGNENQAANAAQNSAAVQNVTTSTKGSKQKII